jgi:hypothetical protein
MYTCRPPTRATSGSFPGPGRLRRAASHANEAPPDDGHLPMGVRPSRPARSRSPARSDEAASRAPPVDPRGSQGEDRYRVRGASPVSVESRGNAPGPGAPAPTKRALARLAACRCARPNADCSTFSYVVRRWPLQIRHVRSTGSNSIGNVPPAAAMRAVVSRSIGVRALSLLR